MKLKSVLHAVTVSLIFGSLALAVYGQGVAVPPAGPQPGDAPWVAVRRIDFSSKHDILILNPDGSLNPMDEPQYISKQIAPGTWQIMGDGDYAYLVEGDKEAIMIDSGYGAGSSRAYAQTLTKQPVHAVANTHPHFDHTANDGYFDRAYMSEGTMEHLPIPAGSFQGIDFLRNFPITVVDDGYKIQLGNRELEVILLGNHAIGSTAYLDRKQRLLFSGDDIMGKQGVAIRVSVERFEKLMEKLEAHRGEYDTVCAGWEMLDASWVDKYLAIAKSIQAGNVGVPASQAPPAPLPNGWPTTHPPIDSQGRTVYIRHVPRGAGAVPPGGVAGAGQTSGAPSNNNMHRVTLDGATVTFDVTKLKD